MEFHEYLPAYDVARQQGVSTPQQFLQAATRAAEQQHIDRQQLAVELDRLKAEAAWIELGRPYYKVWPEVVPLLTAVGIDIPATYLQVPFAAFVLRLPKTDNPLIVDEQHPIRSVMVIEGVGKNDSRVIVLWLDIGERESNGVPMLTWTRLDCLPNRTIEEAFVGKVTPGLPGLTVSDELKDRCLRLAVSVCFLSTGMDRLIEPDVLSKDLASYIESRQKGDEEKSKTIEDRAIRRGKRGWNVGQYERLRTLVSRSGNETADEATTRGTLTHQHQRRAHFRLLASNKVTFIRQATVRPDLPPPDRAPGYGLRYPPS